MSWISVEERLPPKYSDVLIFSKRDRVISALYDDCNGFFNIFIEDYDGSPRYERHYEDVTHWMPLPEAPK